MRRTGKHMVRVLADKTYSLITIAPTDRVKA